MSQFFLTPLPASEVLDHLLAFLEEFRSPSENVQLQVKTSLEEFSYSHNGQVGKLLGDPAFLDFRSQLTERTWLDVATATLTLPRNAHQRVVLTYTHPSKALTPATLNVQGPSFLDKPVLEVMDRVQKLFPLHPKTQAWKSSIGHAENVERMRLQQHLADELIARTNRLDQVLLEQAERSAAHLEELARRQQEYTDAASQQLSQEYEEKRKQLESEFSDRRTQLDARERQHQERVAEFETRESKYVRRHLLSEMDAKLTDRATVQLSEKTAKKRLSVHAICITAIVVGLASMGVGLYMMAIGAPGEWFLKLSPFWSGAVIAGTTTVFYIKWNDRWARRHVDAEFRNINFEQDILRASWLAELLFEWRADEGSTAFPERLIQSFSRGLFVDGKSQDIEHPAEAISALIHEAESIKLAKGAFELTRGPSKGA